MPRDNVRIEYKNTLDFEPIREHRGKYLLRYDVPSDWSAYAILSLAWLEKPTAEEVAGQMEEELRTWARRYPVPIQVFSFSDTDDMIRLSPHKAEDYAIGWIDTEGVLQIRWGSPSATELPVQSYTHTQLLTIYADVPHSWHTATQKRQAIQKLIIQSRTILAIAILWGVAIPVAIALIGLEPRVGVALTILSVLQGIWKLSGLLRWRKPTKRKLEKEAEERMMKHHHYWCERNPVGFARLMGEAIDKEHREQLRMEAEEIRRKSTTQGE